MSGGSSSLPLDDILESPTDDTINEIGDNSDDYDDMQHQIPKSCSRTKHSFQSFARMIERNTIRLRSYVEIIPTGVVGLFASYEHGVAGNENFAPWHEHDYIVNRSAAGSLAEWQHTISCACTDWSL
jgi:hypothetical protein